MGSEFIPLIKADGTPFTDDEINSISEGLDALDDGARVEDRNQNAEEIAAHETNRMLVVSGPGTGKSTLFKKRLVNWLERYPDQRVAVATFVRSLVRDLQEDIANDAHMTAQDKARVTVMTLHRLARSIIERNHGTQELDLKPYCAVVTDRWEEMVWLDAVSLHDEFEAHDFPWTTVEGNLFDAEPSSDGDWGTLRATHVRLEKFYNALTFHDLILFATQAVRENPKLVEDTLFIIDELQDFNRAEDALIREVTAESPGQLLVGDDDQVLYDELKRAHPDILRSYYEDAFFVNAMLPSCGRCSIHICRTAEAFLARERHPDSIKKVFLPLNRADAERVKVVATTSPKVGVEYVKAFLGEHEEGIRQREEEIREGSNKDAYLLILTPARKMNFLNVGGARDELQHALSAYEVADARPGEDYWRLRDYYYGAAHPSLNYNVRKVLAYEQVDQEVIALLLRRALDSGNNLADLEHEAVQTALKKCSAIGEVVDADVSPTDQAERMAALEDVDDVASLASDLEKWPFKKDADSDEESFDFEQKAVISAVELNTIVGVKGLSADHVIVLGCDEVNLQHISSSAFFVALTRARKSLTLMACIQGGGANVLHEFIRSLPDHHVQALYVKADGTQERETIRDLQEQLERWQYQRRKARKKPRARRS
jgi:superfamily I DNA/RNA helicase